MKTKPDDNAFQEGNFGRTNTLTKREYFAALAMQGMMACAPDSIDARKISASISVEIADALIEALNKECI